MTEKPDENDQKPMRKPPEYRKRQDVKETAQQEALVWEGSPYYEESERFMKGQWEHLIWPRIQSLDFSVTLDLAAGQGRGSELLLHHTERLIVVDILESNIEACRRRLRAHGHRVRYLVNDGASLEPVATASVTLVYCFDAMVHFDSDVVRSYLAEAARVLRPGGHAFLHHSNLGSKPGSDFRANPHARAFMSAELMQHYAIKEGFEIVSCDKIDWGGGENHHPELDCLTLLRKPG